MADDTFVAACPNCRTRYRVPPRSLGKVVTCKACGQPFTVAADLDGGRPADVDGVDWSAAVAPAPPPAAAAPPTPWAWRYPGLVYLPPGPAFDQDIVGESHYQANLAALCGGFTPEGSDHQCVAVLVPDDANPHDGQAVRVDIKGRPVGHLSRDDARAYRRCLGAAEVGAVPVACRARVRGGWDRGGGDRGMFGVRLDVPSLTGRGCQTEWRRALWGERVAAVTGSTASRPTGVPRRPAQPPLGGPRHAPPSDRAARHAGRAVGRLAGLVLGLGIKGILLLCCGGICLSGMINTAREGRPIATPAKSDPGPVVAQRKWPYQLLASKTERGHLHNVMDLYHFGGKFDLEELEAFCKDRKARSPADAFYYVVFFDDPSAAVFPNNPFTATFNDERELKHVRAIYCYNKLNGFSELDVYDANMWESRPTTIKP